jgi:hypothetical protein
MPEILLNSYCWKVFHTLDYFLECEREMLADMYDANDDEQREERNEAYARLDALAAAADTDAGLGKLRFLLDGAEGEGHIIDLTGLTNKEVMAAIAAHAETLEEDDFGDYTYVESFTESGNFWTIGWGS